MVKKPLIGSYFWGGSMLGEWGRLTRHHYVLIRTNPLEYAGNITGGHQHVQVPKM